jgi:hypothetical protein
MRSERKQYLASVLSGWQDRQREREVLRAERRLARQARVRYLREGVDKLDAAVADWAAGLRFYGLERAKREGWRIASTSQWDEGLEVLRRRGAVVIWCKWGGRQDDRRVWYFGLPPAHLGIDLESLARDAGMTGREPRTFRWYRGPVEVPRIAVPVRCAA